MQVRCRYFSLLEIIMVVAIILLLSGIAISQLGHLPAFASLNSNSEQLIELFNAAELRALTTGEPQLVTYSDAHRTFSVSAIAEATASSGVQGKKTLKFSLANGVKALFYNSDNCTGAAIEPAGGQPISFTCYADGLISGPDIELHLRKQQLKLHISPLTGAVTIVKPE